VITETAGGRKSVVIDAACLALITLLSALPHITRIGFYSDDWLIVARFHDGRFSERSRVHRGRRRNPDLR